MIGRWHVLTRPLSVRGVGFWLVLASQNAGTLEDVGDPLLESAQRIFAAVGGVRALGAAQMRAESGQLLRQLWDGVTTEEEVRIWERLRPFRFLPRHPVQFFEAVPRAVIPGRGGAAAAVGGGDHESLLSHLHDEAQLAGLALVLHSSADPDDTQPRTAAEVSGMVGGGPALDDWIAVLAATHHIGLSERFTDLVVARRHHRDARRAAQVAVRRGTFAAAESPTPPGSGMVVRFEDVDLATWLLSSRGQQATADKVRQQLDDFLAHEDLVETAITWLANGLDVGATAKALFLHPNSVRYRMRRIEEILHAPLTSPTIIANLYLAFHDRLAPL
ncbi:MAG: helix-turn-helix domain-containing protein [Tetrasphaera sp.]